jgi:hypothetical protein
MERGRNKDSKTPVELTYAEQEAITLSANVFKGRIILKDVYQNQNLCSDEELDGVIEMPENAFLAIIPYFKEEGLDAAHEYLKFSNAGIGIRSCEGGYSHHSREKLAILYLIIQFEIERPLAINALMRDELLCIRKMVDLVNWINNLQNEKDMQAIFEKTAVKAYAAPKPNPALLEEMLNISDLSKRLKISTRTIARYKDQFKPISIGKRNYYLLSECFTTRRK